MSYGEAALHSKKFVKKRLCDETFAVCYLSYHYMDMIFN